MQITHVIRGEDHLMNTPKHLQLFEALGAQAPQYGHIPLILNADSSKMSKRDVGAAVGDYPRQGYIASGVVNFLALLGWSSKSDEEIFTLDELVERFSLEAVNRAPARFDPEKCAWVNQQHVLKLSPEDFAEAAKPFVAAAGLPIDDRYPAVAAVVREKVRLLAEVPAAIGFLLSDSFDLDPEAVEKVRGNAVAKDLLTALANDFAGLSDWSADAAKHQIGETAKAGGAKPGQLMFPVRVALSGKSGGPDLGDILGLLGQEKCVARLKAFAGSL
jgi:glutamyl-tRNA synthetase